MAKDPAFLFYSQDFLVGTMAMPLEDRGKYITILCYMHQNGHLSEETIRLLVGSFSDTLRLKFKQDENGNFFNDRLDVEVEKRQKFAKSRHNNGLKGGRPKKTESTEKPIGYHNENLSENENEDEDAIEIANEIKESRDEIFEKEVLSFFGFNQIANHDKAVAFFEFSMALSSSGRMDEFRRQFAAYSQYKTITGFKHNFYNFLGKQEKRFEDGAWNTENWEAKLIEQQKLSVKQNGQFTKNTTDERRASAAAGSTASVEYLLQKRRASGNG